MLPFQRKTAPLQDISVESPARVCEGRALFDAFTVCMGIQLSRHFARYTLLGLSISPSFSYAQTQWATCPIPALPVERVQRPSQLPTNAVYIEADTALFREKGVSEMAGDVHLSQGDTKLRADRATYTQPQGIIDSSGNVSFSSKQLNVHSQQLHYDLPKAQGEMQQAEYRLNNAEGHGKSKRIVQDQPDVTRLEESSYTTCPSDRADWSLNAKHIQLNHAQERGTANDVTLKIRELPILYLPYLSFPLTDKRQSGFLWPTIGSSEKSGLQFGAPYYYNLAPNYDLTLTPTILGRRGIQLGSEFRYLTDKHKGSVNYVLLPDDGASEKNNRYYFDVNHNTQVDDRSNLTLKAEGVSDDQYFTDLGNSLEATSVVNLERRLEYRRTGDDWVFSGLLQNYQVLDGGTTPHSRTPQLSFRYHPLKKGSGLNLDVETEYTHFSGSKTETNGARLDVATRASKKFTWRNEAVYTKPSITLRHTEYALDNANKTKINRSVPTASLDSGVIFERKIKKGKYVQTLEPRLFYTYTPYREQGNIPIFDSSDRSLSYSQLFAENRFNGKDRIGDNNRLTASVSTRIQSPQDGRELFRASVGQMYYFSDNKVTLPNATVSTGKRSELVLEAAGELNPRTRVDSTAYWDSDTKSFNADEINVRYKDPKKRVLNVGYAERKNDFKSANASFSIPINSRWKAVGAVEQDLLNQRNLETVVGAEYETCCWKTRIASRNYLQTDNKTRDNAVLIELELKGLGNFGSGTRSLLQNRVNGYEE